MFLAISEGWHWRYEVCEHADGYLVQMRDLQTGDLDEDFDDLSNDACCLCVRRNVGAYERHVAEHEDDDETSSLELADMRTPLHRPQRSLERFRHSGRHDRRLEKPQAEDRKAYCSH